MNPLAAVVRRYGRTRWLVEFGRRMVPLDAAVQRRTGGRITMISLAGNRGLLLTTTGHRSGTPRSVPLLCWIGRLSLRRRNVPTRKAYRVAASNFGDPHHPAWSTNLLANPSATVVLHGRTERVTARLTEGDERARSWRVLAATWPAFDSYAERSGRHIRVFLLTPADTR